MGVIRAESARAVLDPIMDKLDQHRRLPAQFRDCLRSSLVRTQTHYSEKELDSADDALAGARIIVRGWAARCRTLADGRRQIFNFIIPGDVLPGRGTTYTVESTICLTVVETVEVGALCGAVTGHPGWPQLLARVAEVEALGQEHLLFDHIVRLGQQNAAGRMADLILELQRRLEAVDLARDNSFELPLKQEHLAEALGLTLVHTNRTLQKLRRDGVLDIHGGKVTILSRRRLLTLAGLDEPHGAGERNAAVEYHHSAA